MATTMFIRFLGQILGTRTTVVAREVQLCECVTDTERENGVKRLPPLPWFLFCSQDTNSSKRQTYIVEMR